MPTDPSSRKRIPALDGLRGIAIIGVLEEHFFRPEHPWLGHWGEPGVAIFFVLSGYLITGNLLRERETGGIQLRRFYLRRALRLWPCAWIYLAIVTVFVSLVVHHLVWVDTWQCVLFVRNFYGHYSISGHFWTLSLEEQFYLIWPLMIVGFRKKLSSIAAAGFIAVGVLRATHWGIWNDPFSSLASQYRADALLLGCFLAFTASTHVLMNVRLLVVACAGFAVLALLPTHASPTLEYLAIGSGMMLTLKHPGISRMLSYAPLVGLGRISYSLYIWQGIFAHLDYPVPAWASPILAVMLTLACAVLSYEFIERPGIRLGSRFVPHKPAPVMTTGVCV